MLRSIQLRDFVIVRELDLEISAGFTVLTGETGAGKSILVDALQLALGARAEPGLVRQPAQRAEVCAQFDCPVRLRDWLDLGGFEAGDSLILRRSVDTQGKSRAWINGSAATLGQLRQAAEFLVDIHGQHAWAQLTRSAELRRLLDAYASIDSSQTARLHAAWQQANQSLEQATAQRETLAADRERLNWQISELAALAPQEHEWASLNAEHSLQTHAQDLLDATQTALAYLQGDEGAIAKAEKALELLQKNEHLAADFKAMGDQLTQSLAQIDDLARGLQNFSRKSVPDTQRLAQLDSRVSLWLQLARRFRRQPEELTQLLTQWKAQLQHIETAGDIDALKNQAQAARQALLEACQALSQRRAEAAPRLAQAVTSAMQGLGMRDGRFEVQLTPAEPGPHGGESVDFLIAGHSAVIARPIAKVASGGELSRIALAIAVTTSQLGEAGTLIFDEVDSGIGGAVAQTVGRLMKQLGKDRQVLAVTHLPQVAACADHHAVIVKQSSATGTESALRWVHGQERASEIARMLGGEKLSETTLAHAKEMLHTSAS